MLGILTHTLRILLQLLGFGMRLLGQTRVFSSSLLQQCNGFIDLSDTLLLYT